MTLITTFGSAEKNQERLVKARIQLAELETPSASIVRLGDVQDVEGVYAETFLDIPPGYGVSVVGLPKESLTARMLEMMTIEQWRGQQMTDAMQQDHEASMRLMHMLTVNGGYQSVVASITPGFDKKKLKDTGQLADGNYSQDDLRHSVETFFDTLVEGGWSPDGNVYLMRPSSAGEIRNHEMVVLDGSMNGWRLPRGLVEFQYEAASQRANHQVQGNQLRYAEVG